MPRLPSGRYVDIMSDRARYHAARLGLRVKPGTPHARLYPFIDILVDHPRAHMSNGRRLGFSGHTLDDVRWLHKWDDADRKAFCAWVREAPQVQTIELARRRLLAEDARPRERVFDYPERLYSTLRHRVAALDLPRAKPEHWRRTLANLCGAGVSREELDWSGIEEFLSSLDAGHTLDKAIILDAIDFTAIRPRLTHEFVCGQGCTLPFEDVAHKMDAYKLQMAGLPVDDADLGVVRRACPAPAYKVGMIWPGGRAGGTRGAEQWFALGPYGQAVTDGTRAKRVLFASRSAAEDAARQHAARHDRARCDLVASAHYDYMTLHGGAQYREWLVTLPDYPHTHFTGHYMDRNVLMHIRTKVRTAACGARVLFIEEIQSDWHQARARKQARGIIPRAPFKNEWPALALKLMLMHAADENLDGVAWADGAVHEQRYDKALPALCRLYDQSLVNATDALARPWGQGVTRGRFATRSPWLHAVRRGTRWRVEGGKGTFATRARYTKDEAMRLIERHSKAVTLSLPMVLFNDAWRAYITADGLPLFGTKPNTSTDWPTNPPAKG